MSDLVFQEVRQKNGRSHRFLIRHTTSFTNDGFYTIGKIARLRHYNYRTKEHTWSNWWFELNGNEHLPLHCLKQIYEFMEGLVNGGD